MGIFKVDKNIKFPYIPPLFSLSESRLSNFYI